MQALGEAPDPFELWFVKWKIRLGYLVRKIYLLFGPINKACAIRWIEMLLYSALAFPVIGFIFSFSYSQLLLKETDYFQFGDQYILGLSGLFCICIVFWLAGFRPAQLLRALKYPGFPIAVLAGLVVHQIYLKHSTELAIGCSQPLLWGTIFYGVALFFLFLFAAFDESTEDSLLSSKLGLKEKRQSLLEMREEEILKWVDIEQEIEDRTQDYFDFAQRAVRTLEVLRRKERTCVAIVGQYGSGKSSLLKLVETEANREQALRPTTISPQLWFCKVSCWGIEKGGSAPEAILNQVIQQLSKRMDCLAVRGLPTRYAGGLSKLHSYLEGLLKLSTPSDPVDQLKLLSPLLKAADVRMVIVLEDVDRNGAEFDPYQIEGLLSRLRSIQEVSFVIAAGPDCRLDFLRLVDHSEALPAIDRDAARHLLQVVWNHCFSDPNVVIISEHFKLAEDIISYGEETLSNYVTRWWQFPHDNWKHQILIFLNTPRSFKATLRRFCRAWVRVKGEVDIEQLLVACALRERAPNHWAFVQRHYDDFSWLGEAQEKNESNPVAKSLREEWKNLAALGVDRIAMEKLLTSLFQEIDPLVGKGHGTRIDCVQSMSHHAKGHVYRDRIFNEDIASGHDLDQPLLRLIRDANQSEDALLLLASRVAKSPENLDHFTFFENSCFKLSRRLALFSALFQHIRSEKGSDANLYMEGLENFCRKSAGILGKQEVTYINWLKTEIRKNLPDHLTLAANILRCMWKDKKAGEEIRAEVTSEIQARFSDASASTFLNAIHKESPDTLIMFFPPGKTYGYWFGPLMLRCFEENPLRAIPLFLELTCEFQTEVSQNTFDLFASFSEKRLHFLFSSFSASLLKQVAHYTPENGIWKLRRGNLSAMAIQKSAQDELTFGDFSDSSLIIEDPPF